MLGKTDHGEEVWLSRRAAESDLVIYLNINLVPMDGGHKSVAVGLAPYQSLRHHHNSATLRDSHSYMDPDPLGAAQLGQPDGQLVNQQVNVFSIETAVNTQMYGGMLDFLQKNEDRFTDWDRLRLKGFRWTLGNLSNDLRRQMLHQIRGALRDDRGVGGRDRNGPSAGAGAGLPAVRGAGQGAVRHPDRRRAVHLSLQRQLDHESGAGAVHGLGYLFNMYRNKPLVKPGGTMIICHPLRDEFHPEHHPSYIEFFHRCLAETTDAAELEQKFEAEFAHNPTYIHMYRYGHAYHGVHPFYMWYWGEPAPPARRARDRGGMRGAGGCGAARMGGGGHAR